MTKTCSPLRTSALKTMAALVVLMPASLPAGAATAVRTPPAARSSGTAEPAAAQQARVDGAEPTSGVFSCGEREVHTGLEKKVC